MVCLQASRTELASRQQDEELVNELQHKLAEESRERAKFEQKWFA